MADWTKDPKEWKGVIPNIPFNLNIPGSEAGKPGNGTKFYPAYSNDVATKIATGLKAKAGWIVAGNCSDTYAVICASNLFKAVNDFVNALNQIRNHDCCCQKQRGDNDQAVNDIDVDLATLLKVIAFTDDVATVEPGDSQDPDATPPAAS